MHTLDGRLRRDPVRWQDAITTVSVLPEGGDWRALLTAFGYTLDRRPLEGALQQAEATLARDTAQAAQAKSTAARYQDLQNRGIATKEQADQSRLDRR